MGSRSQTRCQRRRADAAVCAPAVAPRCAETTASWHARGRNVMSAVSTEAMPKLVQQILAHLVRPAWTEYASGTARLTWARCVCSCEPLWRRASAASQGWRCGHECLIPGCLLVLLRLARGRTAPPPGRSADGQEASVRGLLTPDFWWEADGRFAADACAGGGAGNGAGPNSRCNMILISYATVPLLSPPVSR